MGASIIFFRTGPPKSQGRPCRGGWRAAVAELDRPDRIRTVNGTEVKKKRNRKKIENIRVIWVFHHYRQSEELFYQTFSKMAPAPLEKPLHKRNRRRNCFRKSRSLIKQTLSKGIAIRQ